MSLLNRRTFVRQVGLSGGSLAFAGLVRRPARAKEASPPSERVNLAVIGVRGRGGQLAKDFARRSDSHVAYLCDVDTGLLDSRAAAVEQEQGKRPETVDDFRRALDDPQIDAVVIATPDHWHALATIWATEAGKDVYVEKPLCHSPWEGRQMVRAARRHERVVQVGTQNRSAEYNHKARAYIAEGHLSTLLCQYANISYRLGGRQLTVDAEAEQFVADQEANSMLRREYRKPWVVPG